MNILSLIGSRRTFGALSEGNIPFEIGHIIYMEINVSDVFFFLLYTRDIFKFGHEVLTECGKPGCEFFVQFLIVYS